MKSSDFIDIDLAKKYSMRFSSRLYRVIIESLFIKSEGCRWKMEDEEILFNENFKSSFKKEIATAIFRYFTNEKIEGSVSLKREAFLNEMIDFEKNIFLHKRSFQGFSDVYNEKMYQISQEREREQKISNISPVHAYKGLRGDNTLRRIKKHKINEEYRKKLTNFKLDIPHNVLLSFANHHIYNICTKSLMSLSSVNDIANISLQDDKMKIKEDRELKEFSMNNMNKENKVKI